MEMRYKYNMYNKKVETDIPEKAYGFHIDVQAQEVVDDIIKNFPDTTDIAWESIVEDIDNGGQRDGVSFAYAQMVKDRAVELLENYEYEAAE